MADGQIRVVLLLGNVREPKMDDENIRGVRFKLMIFGRRRRQVGIFQIGEGEVQP